MLSRCGAGFRGRLTNHLTLRVAARISHRRNRINFKPPDQGRGAAPRGRGKYLPTSEGTSRSTRIREGYGFQLSRIVPYKPSRSFHYSTSPLSYPEAARHISIVSLASLDANLRLLFRLLVLASALRGCS